MPRRGVATAEEYEAWLARLDIPVEDTVSQERLSSRVRAIFESNDILPPTGRMIDALWDATQSHYAWQEAGVKPVSANFAFGASVRYYFSGLRGGFGVTRAREIYAERTGRETPF